MAVATSSDRTDRQGKGVSWQEGGASALTNLRKRGVRAALCSGGRLLGHNRDPVVSFMDGFHEYEILGFFYCK